MKYIRIGDIPKNERSGIYRGSSKIGQEMGVSVYNCVFRYGRWHIVMPPIMKEGVGQTYETLINEVTECLYKIAHPRKIYLVSGRLVGFGNDGEPLIRNVKIIEDITKFFIETI